MLSSDHKQQRATVAQQRHKNKVQHLPLTRDRRKLLIRSIQRYPCLYKNEFIRTPYLHPQEKQELWDIVAEDSGFEKTEDAKCKWRSIIGYLRQHLHHVAQKKQRRYIPKTGNPEDKYVQLTDWIFYKDLEFIVPYVKYAASKFNDNSNGNHISPTPTEMDIIINSIEDGLEKLEYSNAVDVNTVNNEGLVIELENDDSEEQVLTEEEEILKEFFENMLQSTLSLPTFHQTRVKKRLLYVINEQKEK